MKKLLALAAALALLLCACADSAGPSGGNEVSIEFGYELEPVKCSPGDEIHITLMARNNGKALDYQGSSTDLFSAPELTCGSYTFQVTDRAATDDATARVFRNGELISCSFTLTVPEDAPAGHYDLTFWLLGEEASFPKVLEIL